MEQHYTYLKEKSADAKHYHYQKYIYLTTTDGLCQSYMLSKNHIKNFLAAYVAKLDHDVGSQMHFNVILSALVTHALVLDVDYVMAPPDNQLDAKNLYDHVLRELKYEMIMPSHSVHQLYEAFLLTREGSQNFHLIFPYVYLNRLDYAALLIKLRDTVPGLDLVHGWMLHRSTKRANQKPYRVVGQYNESRSYMLANPDLDQIMKAQHPRKSMQFIFTHVLFPGEISWFKGTVHVSYPIRISQQLTDESSLILSYMNTQKMVTYYLYQTNCRTPSDGDPWNHNLFAWLKKNQEQWQFRYSNRVIDSYFKKFYPPLYEFETNEEDMTPLAAVTQKLDQLDEEMKKLYYSLNYTYTIDQFLSVIQDYKKLYESVLENMNARFSPYTSQSIVFELAYRYGQKLDSFPDVYICKKQLMELRIIFLSGETENFVRVVGYEILKTLPIALQGGRELHLFSWELRKWKKTLTTSAFSSLLLNGIIDYILNSIRDANQREECRKGKGKFITEQRLEAMIQYQYNHTITPFDENQWLLGLWGCHVLDLKRGVSRLAIPEDFILRTMKYGFDYPDASEFKIFLDEEEYHTAFQSLKAHVIETKNPRTFCYTGYDYIDRLFSFIGMIFCEEYHEMTFFVEFLAWGMIGRNPRRWILFLVGQTSNAKTSLMNLVMDVFLEYIGSFNASNFYSSQKPSNAEGASPELASKLNARFVVIEEVSPFKCINVQALNYYSGNNRLYARQLYKAGRDFDIQFKMMFTMNNLPNLVVTPAIRQRLHILKFKSSFAATNNAYDFENRSFPPRITINMTKYGPTFLSLLIHKQSEILHRPERKIPIPVSVLANLEELSLKEASLTKFENTYVILDMSDSFVSTTEIYHYLHTFKSQSGSVVLESVDMLYDQFCEKHQHRRVQPSPTEDGFVGMSLQSRLTKVR